VLAVILALGAALAWGASDFLGGLKSRSLSLLSVLLVSQAAALALLCAIMLSLGDPPPAGRFLAYAAIAGLGETVGVAALYRGLAVGVMSIVAPVAATAPVVPLLVGLLLGEIPGPAQGAGLALIVCGLVLASRQRQTEGQAARRLAPSFLYGSLSALGFGIFFVALDAASEADIPWALLLARLTAVAAVAAVVLGRRSQIAMRRPDVPVTIAIGALIVAADSMYAAASTMGILSIVATLGALHTVVTIGLARTFLRERIERLQYAGVAACLCGVIVITAV
jgi:drug/metabolite transporter (DMT)-like permease